MNTDPTKIAPTIDDTVNFINLVVLDDKPLGFGAFGAVYKVLHKEWGCQVAYKKLAVLYIGETIKTEQKLVCLVFSIE